MSLRSLLALLIAGYLCSIAFAATALTHNADGHSLDSKRPLILGVYAYRPKQVLEQRYQALADYLSEKLAGRTVELRVLELAELEAAIANNQIDLVFTNPRHFILLRSENALSGTIATLNKRGASDVPTSSLGGVIFTRAERADIDQLGDIQGLRIATASTKHMGGYQCQAYELFQVGIDAGADNQLVETGRHDKAVQAVLDGEADVGFVRTEVLEDLAAQGSIELTQLKIINHQPLDGFPFVSSTRLYPEWPLVALPWVDANLLRQISAALLAIEADDPVAVQAGIAGFVPPADYQSVELVARAMRLPPFDHAPKVSWRDVWADHAIEIVLLLIGIVIILLLLLLLANRGQRLAERSRQLHRSLAEQGRRQEDERILAEATTTLLNARNHELDSAIHEVLALIGDHLGAQHALLQLLDHDQLRDHQRDREPAPESKRKSNTRVWQISDINTHSANKGLSPDQLTGNVHPHPDKLHQQWEKHLGQSDLLILDDLNDAGGDDTLRLALSEHGIKALLGLAIRDERRLVGYLIFERLDHSHHWPVGNGRLFEILADAFAAALNRWAAESRIAEREAYLRSVFDASADGVLVADVSDLKLTMGNTAIQNMLGYDADELKTLTVRDIHPEDAREEVLAHFAEQAGGEKLLAEAVPVLRKDGSVFLADINTANLELDGQRLLVGVFRDISEKRAADQRLRLLTFALDQTAEAVYLVDERAQVQYVNQGAIQMLGYSREELEAMDVEQIDADPMPGSWEEHFDILKANSSLTFNRQHRRKDGSTVNVEVNANHVSFDGKHFNLGFARDITERLEAERKLRLAADVFTHAREGILITEPDGTIIETNAAFTAITGYQRDEVIGQNPRLLKSDDHDDGFYRAMWAQLENEGHWQGELWNRNKQGERFAESLTISAVRDEQGKIQHLVGLFTDITLQKQHEDQLEHIAHHDALTDLPNRHLLADRLASAMARATRDNCHLAVVYIDLDAFKRINDQHGHEIGDDYLRAIAQRLKGLLRETDTVARVGGDEFVAILTGLQRVTDVGIVLDKLLKSIAEPVDIDGIALRSSASLGAAFYPQPGVSDGETLLRQSDQAMYEAKVAGRNRFRIFDPDNERLIRGHHETREAFRNAIENNELELDYQPKVNMRNGDILGYEALVRWQTRDGERLNPGAFLPLIENTEQAVHLDDWVLRMVLQQLVDWQQADEERPLRPVSVNISATSLQRSDFIDKLKALLKAHAELPRRCLELEILETGALADLNAVSQLIHECQQLGIQSALDDFGTGYSSLSYLKSLPVETLKIDQSFILDMFYQPNDLAVLTGILSLADAFGREVIAEGVETVEHGRILLQLGCNFAQGYAVARPMRPAQIIDWERNWQPPSAWAHARRLPHNQQSMVVAVSEHKAWIHQLDRYLSGSTSDMPTLDPHACQFGRWADQVESTPLGERPSFRKAKKLHLEIHRLAHDLETTLREHDQAANSELTNQQLEAMRELHQALFESIEGLLEEGD